MADTEITLQIESEAHDALSDLDRVDTALEKIERSIGNISSKISSLQGMDKISDSMDRLANSIDRIDPSKFTKMASAVGRMASMASKAQNEVEGSFKNIEKEANNVEKEIDSMAKSFAKSYGIKGSKEVEEVTNALRRMAYAYKTLKDTPKSDVTGRMTASANTRQAEEDVKHLIQLYGTVKKEVDETTQSILDYVSKTNSAFSKGTGAGVALLNLNKQIEDFAKMRATLGKAFKSGQEGVSFDAWIQEMNEALGTHGLINADNYIDAFEQLVAIVKDAKETTISFSEALRRNQVSLSDVGNSAKDFAKTAYELQKPIETDIASGFKDAGTVIDSVAQKVQEIPQALEQASQGVAEEFESKFSAVGQGVETATKEVENTVSSTFERIKGEVVSTGESYEKLTGDIEGTAQSAKTLESAMESAAQPTRLSDVMADIARSASEIDKMSATYRDGTAELQALINAYNQLDKAIKGVWTGKTDILGQGEELKKAQVLLEELESRIKAVKANLKEPNRLEIDVTEPVNEIEKLYARLKELKSLIDDMKKNKINFTDADFTNAVKEYADIQKRIKAIQSPEPDKKGSLEWMGMIVAIQHEVEKAAGVMNRWGDIAKNAFIKALTPLKLFKHEFEELKTFVEHIGSGFAMISKPITKVFNSIQKKWASMIGAMQKHLSKLLRTFVYMGFRKIFTQIYRTIGEAVDSLAKFSKTMGTDFNHSVSLAMADFRYLGASILAAFQPLINVVVPILDRFVDALVNAINHVNMFFTVLTGAKSFTIARKKVIDYADALKDANKAAKQLTMGIDELNILNDTRSSSSSKEDEDLFDWQEIGADAIPQAIKDAAEKLKSVAKQLWSPIKEAWDNAGDYVKEGFKHMIDSIKGLLADIGRDFLKVWQQPETVKMLEDILGIFGDIFHIIGNIADGLREAWNYNDTGLHILEDIRDIFATIFRHIHNITTAMRDWSAQLDFKPLLTVFEGFLKQVNYAIDQIGYVFEDVIITVVLPLLQKVLEDYLPRIIGVMGNVAEGIGNIAKKIHEAWDALDFGDKVVAGIDGIVQAILPHLEAVGEIFKEWADNLDFKPLMNAFTRLLTSLEPVADFLGGVFEDIVNHYILPMAKHITEKVVPMILNAISHFADTVDWEKLRKNIDKIIEAFEHLQGAIGEGVADAMDRIGQALAKFVNSAEFEQFINNLADFISKISPELISNVLTAIGLAILKIAEALVKFVNSDAFQHFLNALIGFLSNTDANKLAGYLLNIAKAVAFFKFAAFVGKGFANFLSFVAIIGKIGEAKALKNIAKTLGEVGANASKAGTSLSGIGAAVGGVVKIVGGVAAVIGGAVLAIKEFVDMWVNGWSVIKTILEALGLAIAAVGAVILGAPAAIAAVIAAIIFVVSQLAIALHEHWDAISSWFATTWENFKEWVSTTWQGIVQGIKDAWNGLQEGIAAVWDAISQWFNDVWTTFKEWVATTWQGIVQGVVDAWNGIKEALIEKWNGIKEWFEEAWDNFHTWASETWNGIKDSIAETWDNLKESAITKFGEIRDEIAEKWENIKTNTLTKWDEIKSNLDQKWNTFKKDAETLWNNLKESISKTWDTIQSKWTSTWQSIKQAVAEKWNSIVNDAHSIFEGIGAFFKSLWDGIESTWDSVWSAIKSTVSAWWENIRTDAQTGWDTAVSFVKGLWDDIQGKWGTTWDSISTTINTKWQSLRDGAISLWEKASSKIGGIWEKVKQGWTSTWQSIGDFIKKVFNGVIGGLEGLINGAIKGINTMIGLLNKLSFTVPDWIPEIGGMSFGFNLKEIPEIRIPKFATGGMPEDGLFFANHNELVGKFSNGQTAVANNQQITEGIKEAVASAMMPVLNEIAVNTRETANKDFSLNVDSREIARSANTGQGRLGRTILNFT